MMFWQIWKQNYNIYIMLCWIWLGNWFLALSFYGNMWSAPVKSIRGTKFMIGCVQHMRREGNCVLEELCNSQNPWGECIFSNIYWWILNIYIYMGLLVLEEARGQHRLHGMTNMDYVHNIWQWLTVKSRCRPYFHLHQVAIHMFFGSGKLDSAHWSSFSY